MTTTRDAPLDRMGAASGILSAVLIFAGFAMTGDSNPPSPDEPSANLAAYVSNESQQSDLYVFGPPLATLIGATSVAAVLSAALPRWLRWAGLLVTVLLLIAPLSFFGFLLFFVWVVVVSGVWLCRSFRGPDHEVATQGV